jgi:hypothetical protein
MNRILLTIMLLALAGMCIAQVADGLTPLQRKQLTVLAEPATLYKGFLRVGYEIKYSRPGRTFDKNGVSRPQEDFTYSGSYVDHLLSLSYGLSDRLQLSVVLPYVNDNLRAVVEINQSGNQLTTPKIDITSKGFGDLQTEMRFQIIKETTKVPSLVAGLGVWLPTGNNERTISTDAITNDVTYKDITGGVGSSVIATVQLRKIMYPYLLAAEFNYFFGAEGEIIENGASIDVLGANSAIWQLTTGMHLNEWITLTGKLFYQRLSFDSEVEPNTTVPLFDNSKKELLTLDPTLTFQFGRIRSQQVIAIPLYGKNSTAELEYSASLQYTF